jgi:phosphoglucosamine mutase
MYPDAAAGHAEYILKNFPHDLKLKVVVDCGGAAAFWITPYILRALGCEVIALNCLPAGVFPHDVEPVEANLGELMRTVRDSGADLGIAHDGDADRMMAVDNRGRFISGDKMLALLAKAGAAREIVTTIDASMSIEEMGFKVVRTRVGDPYVSAELKKNGFAFGGEPSGAWVFPAVSYCPDGIYAAVLIAVAAGQQNLAELVDNIPTYPVRRGSVKGRGIPLRELENGLMVLEPVSLIRADGLKLGFNDGWLLVRPSGTEPKIRISAEAKSEARVRQLYDAGVEAAQNCVALHPGEIRRIE